MSEVGRMIDKEGPKLCNWGECPHADAPTERYGIVLLLYPREKTIHQAIQLHLSLQVCKTCQGKVVARDLIDAETAQMMFQTATANSEFPVGHHTRLVDVSRSKVAFRTVGRYEP